MSILTDQEIHDADPAPHNRFDQERIDFARAIEAVVIARLATVSVEPVACYAGHRLTPEGTTEFYGYADKKLEPSTMLYPAEALAAARVQALEEAVKVCEDYANDRWNLYKGRPPYNGTEQGRADLDTQGHSDGASVCAEAIRALIGGKP